MLTKPIGFLFFAKKIEADALVSKLSLCFLFIPICWEKLGCQSPVEIVLTLLSVVFSLMALLKPKLRQNANSLPIVLIRKVASELKPSPQSEATFK